MGQSPRLRLFIAITVVLCLLVTLIWWLSASKAQREQTAAVVPIAPSTEVSTSIPPVAEPSLAVPYAQPDAQSTAQPTPSPPAVVEFTPQPSPSPEAPITAAPGSSSLLIPVAGVRPEQLRDTFKDARSEGRVHDAIDIPAPRGTPVVAAADGRIVKLFESVPGGTTIYQLGTDDKTIYYYAHLERYADGLREGQLVRRGEVIAYVGDTGNAGAGNYHLHFSISIVSDPKRYWQGTNINPYPLLRQSR